MSQIAFAPPPALGEPPVSRRFGAPSRAAIMTALAASAVRLGHIRAVLVLAQTARPRSLLACPGELRGLALAGLKAVYPDANPEALDACLRHPRTADRRRASRSRDFAVTWAPGDLTAVSRAIADNEAAQLTGRWIWPHACAVAAEHTGAEAAVVATVTGSRATPPRIVARARKLAVYLTMTEGDVNLTAMAAATGLDKSTVRFHVEGLGDARDDDPALDAELETLSARLRERLDQELSQW